MKLDKNSLKAIRDAKFKEAKVPSSNLITTIAVQHEQKDGQYRLSLVEEEEKAIVDQLAANQVLIDYAFLTEFATLSVVLNNNKQKLISNLLNEQDLQSLLAVDSVSQAKDLIVKLQESNDIRDKLIELIKDLYTAIPDKNNQQEFLQLVASKVQLDLFSALSKVLGLTDQQLTITNPTISDTKILSFNILDNIKEFSESLTKKGEVNYNSLSSTHASSEGELEVTSKDLLIDSSESNNNHSLITINNRIELKEWLEVCEKELQELLDALAKLKASQTIVLENLEESLTKFLNSTSLSEEQKKLVAKIITKTGEKKNDNEQLN